MTTTYEPNDPRYLDEADVRRELTRAFDLCHGCRRCVDLCTVFPSLFEMLDRAPGEGAGRLTPAEQDAVTEQCFQCTSCRVGCPYGDDSPMRLDVARLVLRAEAMKTAAGHHTLRRRATTQLLGRADLLGRVAARLPSLSGRLATARPGSPARRMLAVVTGISAVRRLPRFAGPRFSSGLRRQAATGVARREVAVFPGCVVDFEQPAVGSDLVGVYARNGVRCTATTAGCCGAPWLHAGDLKRFARVAVRNAAILADEVRAGRDIVVTEPGCGHVLRRAYCDHVAGPDAELVAGHTFDAVEYLMDLHRSEGIDTVFGGEVPTRIVYHPAPQLRGVGTGVPGRESPGRALMELIGAEVVVVDGASGSESWWGLRADQEQRALLLAARFAERLTRAGGDAVAADGGLTRLAIAEQTGEAAWHPIQLIARAYGLPSQGPAARGGL
ncbi:MAG TPA: heterodisulfide reductase-related iron-sulfur binding cluster [Ilumatobacter sp.]